MKSRILPPLIALSSLLCLLSTTALQAVVVVSYGGNYPTGSFTNGSIAADNFGGFSSGNPILLYDLPSGPDLYGQVNWTAGVESTGSGGEIDSSDRIVLKRGMTNLAAVITFRQSDFQNGLGSGNLSFDASNTATMTISTDALFDAGRVVIRLQGGSQDGYYISQEGPFENAGVRAANLTSLTWLAYDPATDIRAFGSVTNLLEGGLINNVTEVGFYVQQAAGALTNDATAFRVTSFVVTGIPEPSAGLTAILALGALALVRRRGNRRDVKKG